MSQKSILQAQEYYTMALEKCPSDQVSKEGLEANKTVSANLDAG